MPDKYKMKAGSEMVIKASKWFCLCFALLFMIGMGRLFMAQAESSFKKALIIVDPGFSKSSFNIGQNIAEVLNQKGISVKLEKVNEFRPSDLAGIDLLVLGGPTYMAQPSGGLKKAVARLNANTSLKVLLFQTGGSDCAGLAPLSELVKAKGLLVIGECGFVLPRENAEISAKIAKLLANI
jgi:Uncharacterized flavoproteins